MVDFINLQFQDNFCVIFLEICEIMIMVLIFGEFDMNNDNYDGIIVVDLLMGIDVLEFGEDGLVNFSLYIENCGGNLGLFFNNVVLLGVVFDGIIYFDVLVDGI